MINQGDMIDKKGDLWVCIKCAGPGTHPKSASRGSKAPTVPKVFAPTSEQQDAIDFFSKGDHLAIQAGAGTGKTSTLVALANSVDFLRQGQYVAFNKAIVTDAGGKLPPHVKSNTAHSIAYRVLGWKYKDRLGNATRMRSDELAKVLKLKDVRINHALVEGSMCASVVMEALGRFCQSADQVPDARHFPYVEGLDKPADDGDRTYHNNNALREHLLPVLNRAWDDVQWTDRGEIPFDHAFYLKIAQLQGVELGADFVLFDEAQDAVPCVVSMIKSQGVQTVWVGDPNQAIYEWAGAVDAFKKLGDDVQRTSLTQSFRFGEEIADIANLVLSRLDGFQLVGNPSVKSSLCQLPAPDAILARTNAGAISETIEQVSMGREAHLMGDTKDILQFLDGSDALRKGRKASHRDLACFTTWLEVQDYVSTDTLGKELKCLVNLVDRFGTFTIRDVLKHQPTEANADVVVSTAHKAKGREWTSVRLAEDFASCWDEDATPADLRLLYVALTRARTDLDVTKTLK
jgi:hypothetical protein